MKTLLFFFVLALTHTSHSYPTEVVSNDYQWDYQWYGGLRDGSLNEKEGYQNLEDYYLGSNNDYNQQVGL